MARAVTTNTAVLLRGDGVCIVVLLCLVFAAYLSLFKPHAAARVALLASLAIWMFYGPAMLGAIEFRMHKEKSELFLQKTTPRSVASPSMHKAHVLVLG